MSDSVDEVSYKPMSLYKGSNVIYDAFNDYEILSY